MAAPKENQFWKIRSKHGRDRLFSEPKLLEDAFKEYINWVDAHPWYKIEQLKKPYLDPTTKKWVTLAKVPTVRPYTIQGFCIYVGANVLWFNEFEKSLIVKDDQISKDFSIVCSHVRDVIYQQKFEGAAVGAFNPSIIQRDLGLRETSNVELQNPPGGTFKTETKMQHEVIFKKMSDKTDKDEA